MNKIEIYDDNYQTINTIVATKEFAEANYPNHWRPVIENIPKPIRHITCLAFERRLTDNEAIAIDMASQGSTMDAAYLRRFISLTKAASYIDLDDPTLAAGLYMLESVGLLAKGRTKEIIGAPIQGNEGV